MSSPYALVPMRSANSSWVSFTSSIGGGIRGKVSMSACTGIERSTRRLMRAISSSSFRDAGERARRGGLYAAELVEGGEELAARGELGEIDEAFDERDAGLAEAAVQHEVLGRPARVARRGLLEEVAADAAGLAGHEPLGGRLAERGRAAEVARRADCA